MEILKHSSHGKPFFNCKIIVFGRRPIILRSRSRDGSYSRSQNTFMFLVLSEYPVGYNEKEVGFLAEIRLFSIFITKKYKTLNNLLLL